jgi:[ribosomal protein S5]-alanine N-acetyltransferase
MHLQLTRGVVRDWAADDVPALVRHGNNRNVWINLRDRFPHPYRERDAQWFVEQVGRGSPPTVWAIEVDGEAAGAIGVERLTDVERVSAEIGYWLGEQHWGKGIVTEVLRAVTAHAFATFEFSRIFAVPFADNTASIRVLEKAGYVLEGRMRQSAIKDAIIRDQMLYAAYHRVR